MILFKSKFAGSEIYITDAYTRAYLAIAEQRGLDIHELLDHVAVEETESPDIDAFETKSDSSKDNAIYSITANEYLTLIEKIVDKSGNHGIALEVGLQIPPTAFGMVGFAMMSSATVESAMEVGTRYWHLLRDGIAINVSIEDDTCCIEFDFFQELQEKLENLVLETSMASCFRVIQLIFGEKFTSELWLKQPSPYYSELYLPMIPNLKYDQQKNQLRFPKDLLSLKIPTSSELSLSMALEKCEEENQLMSENGMIFQLERYLKKCEGKFPSLVEAAEHFSMSPRMFRRTLEASGSNYRAMVEETKSHLARQLLVETSLDVAIIAERLGYKDTGNFSRAFRQWTGFPPGKYRSLPNSKKNLNDQ